MKSIIKLTSVSTAIGLLVLSTNLSADTVASENNNVNSANSQMSITNKNNTRTVIIQGNATAQVTPPVTNNSDQPQTLKTERHDVSDEIMYQARLIAHDAEVAAQLDAEREAEANFAAKQRATENKEQLSIPF